MVYKLLILGILNANITVSERMIITSKKCPWCNGYRRRKWTRRHEFKSWMRLIAFHIALIPLGIILPPAMGKL